MKKLVSIVLVLLLVTVSLTALADDALYISVISKGEQHAFWQAAKTRPRNTASKCSTMARLPRRTSPCRWKR